MSEFTEKVEHAIENIVAPDVKPLEQRVTDLEGVVAKLVAQLTLPVVVSSTTATSDPAPTDAGNPTTDAPTT